MSFQVSTGSADYARRQASSPFRQIAQSEGDQQDDEAEQSDSPEEDVEEAAERAEEEVERAKDEAEAAAEESEDEAEEAAERAEEEAERAEDEAEAAAEEAEDEAEEAAERAKEEAERTKDEAEAAAEEAEDEAEEAAERAEDEAEAAAEEAEEAAERVEEEAERAEDEAEAAAEGAEDDTEEAAERTDDGGEEEEAKPVAAAAADDDDDSEDSAEPVEVSAETVTEETSRSSDEEVDEVKAQRDKRKREGRDEEGEDRGGDGKRDEDGDRKRDRDDDDDDDDFWDDDIVKILGAGAAGLAVGMLLDDGGEVVDNTGDRVIIERDGQYFVRKDDNELLRRPGSVVRTEQFSDGSTRTIVEREDGVQVVTIRDRDGYVVRRTRVHPDGRQVVLFDDTGDPQRNAQIDEYYWLPQDRSVPFGRNVDYSHADQEDLRDTLLARPIADFDRRFSLRQIRENREVRDLMPALDLDTITFDFGSAAISRSQVAKLDGLGQTIEDILHENSGEMFYIEGHTDAVGSRAANLTLSDRRAESVALALTEYYDIPPENLVTQGYGEEYLKVQTQEAERVNRRATVRRITPLLENSQYR